MKILKLLNKRYLSIIIILFFSFSSIQAEDEPVDIWNLDKEKLEKNSNEQEILTQTDNENQIEETDVFKMQSNNNNKIKIDDSLDSKEIKIIGIYDPEDYGLNLDMWLNSNGDQLKYLFSNISKIDLSDDAAELMNITLLTNAYYPNKNISEKEFLKIKSKWLIKNNNLELIEEYLLKNQILNLHPGLSKYLVDEYLSESNLQKACDILLKNSEPFENDYLSKFKIYCLINEDKREEAQLIFDLKKELGFKDKYFENKINFLFGYTDEIDNSISENSILDFHLAHRANSEFIFEPKEKTNKLIWKYLATSNLLFKIEEIDLNKLDKIALIEKATNDRNYSEKDLFEIYKRFQFNINQLLNVNSAHKSLTNIEARALIYQRLLLESNEEKKLELIKILKDSFIKDNLENAFDIELKKFLKNLEFEKIPSNLSSFYYKHLSNEETEIEKNIKFNNDILHQSKIINYFNGDYTKTKIEKDLNNFLKKIKKNKKYLISKKDIILIESLKSDGIEISKKYKDLYEVSESEMPTDIQVMINNNETGAVILRIIEVIGQDKIEKLDEDTLYFIISALNQLNIDFIRNKILFKVLPLKV